MTSRIRQYTFAEYEKLLSYEFWEYTISAMIIFGYALYYVIPLIHLIYNFLVKRDIPCYRSKLLEIESHSSPKLTLIKPITSRDSSILSGFDNYFKQDYKNIQIIFCFLDSENPLIEKIRVMMLKYSNVDCKICTQDSSMRDRIQGNKKIANIMQAVPYIKGEIIWIADESIEVTEDAATSCISQLNTGYQLVHMIPYWKRHKGFVDMVNFTFFNTMHARMYDTGNLVGMAAMSGMSFFLSIQDLKELGGLAELKNYIAEDGMICKKIKKNGKKITVSYYPAVQKRKNVSLMLTINRLSRWHQIRIHFSIVSYVEFILLPLLHIIMFPIMYGPVLTSINVGRQHLLGLIIIFELLYHLVGLKVSGSRFLLKDILLLIPSWIAMQVVIVSACLLAIWNRSAITWIDTKYYITKLTYINKQETI